MKKLFYTLIFAIMNFVAINVQANQSSENIWIDVRTVQEYSEGHLENAVNIPVEQIAQEIDKLTTDKSAHINLYCRSGRRADVAMKELNRLGFTNVTNHGGYQELLNKGMK